MPIILASQSPRRKMLLDLAGVPFTVKVVPTDESFPAGLPFEEIPVHIARNKAAVVTAGPDDIIIAADTVVVLENQVIGKPSGREEAIGILTRLAGKLHRVITGVVVVAKRAEISFAEITEVEFHPLSRDEIIFYVDRYQPYDKAGAYAIQEWIGVTGIKKINGDFYNVMGLPVSRVVKTLRQLEGNTLPPLYAGGTFTS